MADALLQLRIVTPHETVFEGPVEAARVPTPTGQVGLRPRQEPCIIAVEPGLILLRDANVPRFAARPAACSTVIASAPSCTRPSPPSAATKGRSCTRSSVPYNNPTASSRCGGGWTSWSAGSCTSCGRKRA